MTAPKMKLEDYRNKFECEKKIFKNPAYQQPSKNQAIIPFSGKFLQCSLCLPPVSHCSCSLEKYCGFPLEEVQLLRMMAFS